MNFSKIILVSLIFISLCFSMVSAWGYQPYGEYDSTRTVTTKIEGDSYWGEYRKTKVYDRSTNKIYYPDGDMQEQVVSVRTTYEDYDPHYNLRYSNSHMSGMNNRFDINYYDYNSYRYPSVNLRNNAKHNEHYYDDYYYRPVYDWNKGYYNWRYS